MKKYLSSFIVLGFLFSVFPTHFIFIDEVEASQTRNPGQYLIKTKNKKSKRVLLIGNGHKSSIKYPFTYYLVDKKKSLDPDLVLDITQEAFPQGLFYKFPIVIWEYVDADLLVNSWALKNVIAVLEKGGILIIPMFIDVKSKGLLGTPAVKELKGLEPGLDYIPLENWRSGIPFIFYVSGEYYKNAVSNIELKKIVVKKYLNKVFSPFFENNGFKNIKILSQQPKKWLGVPVTDGYISMEKK